MAGSVAFTGLGRFASLVEAQAALVTAAARFEPNPSRKAAYDALFALYLQSEQALAPISQELANWRPGGAGGSRAPGPVRCIASGRAVSRLAWSLLR